MQISGIGIVWFFLCFICILAEWKYIIRLLLISAPFQGAAAFNLNGYGLPLFMLVEISIIVKAMLELILEKKRFAFTISKKTVIPLFGFLLWNIFVNFVLSRSFTSIVTDRGTNVWNKMLIILIHFLTFFAVDFTVNSGTDMKCGKYLTHSVYIMIVIVLVLGNYTYFAVKNEIHLEWMQDIISNNAGYPSVFVQMGRLHIPFLEPSYCGGFLAPAFWGLVAMNESKSKIIAAMILPTLALNASSTGIGAFVIGFLLFFVIKNNSIYWKWLFVILTMLIVILSNDEIRTLIISMTIHKFQSYSGVTRISFDIEAIRLCIRSWGLGVGFVNCRASSFVTTLLATTGVVGTALFCCFLCGVIDWKSLKECGEMPCYCVALIVTFAAQSLALPDINYSMLWLYVIIITVARGKGRGDVLHGT